MGESMMSRTDSPTKSSSQEKYSSELYNSSEKRPRKSVGEFNASAS